MHSGVGEEVVGGNDAERGVAATNIPRAKKVDISDGGPIFVAGEAIGVKRQGPSKDIAIIANPSVNNFDVPSAIHRTADEGGKGLVGMVEMGA